MTIIRAKSLRAPHVEEALKLLGETPKPTRTRQEAQEYERNRQKARQRALRRLADTYPDEFEALLREEYQIVGLRRT